MKIKNTNTAKRFAKKILKKYKPYVINSATIASGTNTWAVTASSEELEITLSLDQESGKLVTEPEIQRVVKRTIEEPPIQIMDFLSGMLHTERDVINWWLLAVTIGFTVVGSIVSAFVDKNFGILISLIFGGFSIWFGKYAFTHIIKEKEI